MGMTILAILVFVVTIILFLSNDYYIDFGSIVCSVLIGLITTLLFVLIMIPISFLSETKTESKEQAVTVKIQALKDNSRIEGNFFLGTGYVGEEQYYYYVEQSIKGKRVNKISVNEEVYINESADEQPRLEIYDKVYTSKFAKFMYGEKSVENSEYIFYVPNDTVTTEFNVDME